MTSANTWTSDSSAYLKPRPSQAGDAWAAEAEARGSVGSQRLLFVGTQSPPPAIAAALQLAADQEAVLRRRLVLRDGQPIEVVDSWYPASVAIKTTRLADPRKIPGGAVTALAELGYTAGAVIEDVEASLPGPTEREALGIGEFDPVLVLTRLTSTADGQPFEVSVMTTPGKERRLRYEMRV